MTDGNRKAADLSDELINAVKEGKHALLERLLTQGGDPNTRHGKQETLLQTASRAGDVTTVRLLLAAGAAPNRCRGNNEAPIMLALGDGRSDVKHDVLAALLAAGADPNLISRSRYMYSPLNVAVGKNDIVAARMLLDHGASVHACDHYGYVPTERILNNSCCEMGKLLLEAGLDPVAGDAKGVTPLHRAAGNKGSRELLALYMDGLEAHELNVLDTERGDTPLHWAISGNHLDNAAALLEKGALADGPADARELMTDENGNCGYATPLKAALERDHMEGVELLILHGADPYQPEQYAHWFNIIQGALSKENYEQLLVMMPAIHKADKGDILVGLYLSDQGGWRGRYRPFAGEDHTRTPTDQLADEHRETELWARAWPSGNMPTPARREFLERVLSGGMFSLDTTDSKGNTLLHHLCCFGAPSQDIQLLVKYGADVNAENSTGMTPLLTYLDNCDPTPTKAGVNALLDNGAIINHRDQSGRGTIAVLRDAFNDDVALRDWLLNAGAEPEHEEANNEAPIPDPESACQTGTSALRR